MLVCLRLRSSVALMKLAEGSPGSILPMHLIVASRPYPPYSPGLGAEFVDVLLCC